MLHLYDTRERAVVPIEPWLPGRLSVYACGPTVYRDAHVGNLRTFLLPDLIRRTASARGLAVTVVQNITDVGHMLDDTGLTADAAAARVDSGQEGEDRMLRASQSEGSAALAVARRYEAAFRRDCARLGIAEPTRSPRASECIESMVDIIEQLLDSGHAYVGADGSVFFDACSFPGYGAISGNRLDALRPGHRFEGASDPNKRFHADWALWKAAPATRQQLVWETRIGRGFPGWHIECTAMLLEFLGDHVDIHTGGIDLRFPHHEDERAQTESVVGHEVVRHWVHAEHLLFEGRKMSKSAGNVVLLDDVIARGMSPSALRLAFLEQHYRTQVDLSWASIAAADRLLTRWRTTVSDALTAADRVSATSTGPTSKGPTRNGHDEERSAALSDEAHDEAHDEVRDQVRDEVYDAVLAAFEDDLDTARAVRLLREFERADAPLSTKAAVLLRCDALLGLDLAAAPQQCEAGIPGAVQLLLDARAAARAARDWGASDAFRDELRTLGWVVTDTADGQRLQAAQR